MNARIPLQTASVCTVIGSILAVLFNIGHPVPPDIGDAEAFFEIIATSPIWVSDHIGLAGANLLILLGLVGFYRSFEEGGGAYWARLGVASALVAGAVGLVLVGFDGMVQKAVAQAWVAAPPSEKAIAFRIAEAVNVMAVALFSLWIVVHFGVTFTLYGLAVALGEGYPQWLGWVAVGFGLVAIADGGIQSFTGLSQLTVGVLFPLVLLALTIWLLVMAVLLWRKAGAAA